ncbi:hypothetical protein SAY87_000712 [Trapa incisa]|uniref:Uncharacterized protein n=1 Tax=Trapa incisa TaxID=236973 RepID=A0AAN7GFQ1_9MYRT|nr:hypothetical protein SAY87_000712 [Trapa incisa]
MARVSLGPSSASFSKPDNGEIPSSRPTNAKRRKSGPANPDTKVARLPQFGFLYWDTTLTHSASSILLLNAIRASRGQNWSSRVQPHPGED